MRWDFGVAAAFVASVGAPAAIAASEEPVYAPAPEWAKSAPAIDVAALDNNSPVILLMDQQHRFGDGGVTVYSDSAFRMASTQIVNQAGTIQLPWQPHHGDLVIHRAEILRGDERIDLLAKGERFTVLRREEQLEQLQLNGVLTATLTVEDLRVGDVLRLTTSVNVKDDALGGHAQTIAPLISHPVRAEYARTRLIWPKDMALAWRALAPGVDAKPVTKGDFQELEVVGMLDEFDELPSDAPLRYQPIPLIEATTFADWQAVSRTMAPHYATEGLIAPNGPIAAEVAKIKAASNDPRTRAAHALRVVQDEIRYLFNGMEGGNYVPQPPAETWSLRYGDCKAKTLLLLAMLRDLGIEAEPVLAHSQMGDLVPKRLPSAAAFDHVIVRAEVGGDVLWLDGTRTGDRLADIGDTPTFRHVLPLRTEGADLMPLPTHAPARPLAEVDMAIDQSAGLALPALYSISMELRGAMAEMANTAWSQANAEQREEMTRQLVSPYAPDSVVLDQSLTYDRDSASVVVKANGFFGSPWRIENERYRIPLDIAATGIGFEPDRARAAWRDIPVATADPQGLVWRRRITLPATGFTFEGDTTLPARLAGRQLKRTATIDGKLMVVEDSVFETGAEIAAADIAATRAAVASAQQRALKGLAPAGYPARYEEVIDARSEGRLKPLLAAYAEAIADAPDEVTGYRNRAVFLTGIFDYQAALADLDKAIELETNTDLLYRRSALRESLGDMPGALADAEAALALEPAAIHAIGRVARLHSEMGEADKALAMIDERIDLGGEQEADYLATKSDILARHGRVEEAIAAIDAAVTMTPANPNLLNNRCWLKGTMNTALESGLKDCTRSIELGENPAAALDSRAMVYFRMGRLDEALADLDAALDIAPGMPAAMYLRGVIRTQQGDEAGAKADFLAARTMAPRIAEEYDRWGVKP